MKLLTQFIRIYNDAPDISGFTDWLKNDWLDPIWGSIQIAIVPFCCAAIGVQAIVYYFRGQQGRHQEPFSETVKIDILILIVVEALMTIIGFLI